MSDKTILSTCLLAGSAVAIGLYAARAFVLPPAPWDDLFVGPLPLAQGAFAAASLLALLAWGQLRRREAQVAAMTADDRAGWAAVTRQDALTSDHPRPRLDDRRVSLDRCRDALMTRADRFWLLFVLLGVAPAVAGTLFGLRADRLNASS